MEKQEMKNLALELSKFLTITENGIELKNNVNDLIPDNSKKCSKCKTYKSLENYGKKAYNKDGLNHYCKSCENKMGKEKYNNDTVKENVKYKAILRNYGLTKEQYILKIESQNNKCVICTNNIIAGDKNTHVDHCHKSGKTRDILCHRCNKILGMVNDDIDLLNRLIKYLQKYS